MPTVTLCGKPTRRGKPCTMPLRGGKCVTHDAKNLKARNRKVVRAFKANNPTAFQAQRVAAGKLGFKATGEKVGWMKANRNAAKYRVAHPSGPERFVEQALKDAGYAPDHDFKREHEYNFMSDDNAGRTIDFAFVDFKIAVEVNGAQHYKPAFGESVSRSMGDQIKQNELHALGWTVYEVDATKNLTAEVSLLLEFLNRHVPNVSDPNVTETEPIPF